MVSTLAKLDTQNTVTIEVVDYVTYKRAIHSVRYAVFVCEQSIPAAFEIDRYDLVSQHVLALWEGCAVGTGRLTPEGRIGRVAVAKHLRHRGIGRCLMEKLLEVAKQQQHQEVILAAQHQAIPFYERLGFYQEGHIFKEVGIKHVMMRRSLI
ncbi:MAG: GNAT family N-acetyltransferase [Leptolyngbya sp. SIO1D8]|nr:GNAT family N-acetyltransferase [Leptolyngbya sp. SIO1D8]